MTQSPDTSPSPPPRDRRLKLTVVALGLAIACSVQQYLERRDAVAKLHAESADLRVALNQSYAQVLALQQQHQRTLLALRQLEERNAASEDARIRDALLTRPELLAAYTAREQVADESERRTATLALVIALRDFVYRNYPKGPQNSTELFATNFDLYWSHLEQVGPNVGVSCGGVTALYRICLHAVGVPSRRAVWFTNNTTPYDSHTTSEVQVGDDWVLMDATFNFSLELAGRKIGTTELSDAMERGAAVEVVTDGRSLVPAKPALLAYFAQTNPDRTVRESFAHLLRYWALFPAGRYRPGNENRIAIHPPEWDGVIRGYGRAVP